MTALPANETRFLAGADAVAQAIADGAVLALPPDYSLPAMEVVRALVRRRARGLRLLGVPVLGLCADLLIGAGCVAEVESSAVSLGEAGLAPRFSEAAESGAVMLNAPVSGSVITLQEGKLSIMVGGPREAFDRVKPILEDIGPTVTHVGGNLQAVSMKIATNLSLAVQMLAFCEAVLLAEKSGVARDMALDVLGRETAVEVLVNTVVASPMVRYRGPFVLSMPVEAWFNVNMMQKDLNLALEMGQRLNVPLPTTAISNEFLTAARGMGFAKRDFAVVFDVLARMAGVDTGVEK